MKRPSTLNRTFYASKELIFDALATAQALAQWWGPVEAPIDVVSLDFRPEGIFHYKMKGTHISYGIFRYKKMERPDNITWINSFADENGAISKPPFKDFDLPKEILNTITLTETDGITTLVLKSEPINASESEINCFYSITKDMEQGFSGTLNQLADYLNKIKK